MEMALLLTTFCPRYQFTLFDVYCFHLFLFLHFLISGFPVPGKTTSLLTEQSLVQHRSLLAQTCILACFAHLAVCYRAPVIFNNARCPPKKTNPLTATPLQSNLIANLVPDKNPILIQRNLFRKMLKRYFLLYSPKPPQSIPLIPTASHQSSSNQKVLAIMSASHTCFAQTQDSYPLNVYNLLMLQKEHKSLFVQQLLGQIQSDDQFRNHHLSKQNRGVFKMIRLGFDAMVALLQTYCLKQSSQPYLDTIETLKIGGKVFAYSEYKLFIWVSVWLIGRHKISYNQIFSADLAPIQALFNNKEPTLLRFEFFLIVSIVEKRSCVWKARESQHLDLLARKENQGEKESEKKRTNWRLISYRMFLEKGYAKTPHECRERWTNHLNPKLSKSKWKLTEDLELLNLCQEHGPKWSKIARLIGKRNEHMVKNRFNSIKNKWVKKVKLPFKIRKAIKDIRAKLEDQGNRSQQSINQSQCKEQEDVEYIQEEMEEYEQVQFKVEQPDEIPQIPVPQYQQTFINLCEPNRLSMADVQECDDYKQDLNQVNLLSIPHQFSTRFIWTTTCQPVKQNSRRETADDDYEWLDDMIEQKNMNWLEDEEF